MIKMKILTGPEFKEGKLNQIVNRGKLMAPQISSTVKKIIQDVQQEGDKALLFYTEKFDNVRLSKSKLKVTREEIKKSFKILDAEQITALEKAALNIRRFHENQIQNTWSQEMVEGVTVGQITRPLSSVGIYAPGGAAPYPSSVLMCTIPAKVAGVKDIHICSPPNRSGEIHPALLVAADIAGASEIYRVGGAQAIAALAYGTESVPQVDKIVGPGNVFVTTAKLEVNKDTAIDIPAGPSEVLIIADETADPSFIASDLLAQAEHDPEAIAILFTTSKELALAVDKEVDNQLKSLPRKKVATISIQSRGMIVLLDNIERAIDYTNKIAPEHLAIQTRTPRMILERVKNAGAVFLGPYSPVAFGDYSAGLNHVLPTGGYAKVYSGLSTKDFSKTINFLECTQEGYRALKRTTIVIAELEGLMAHTKSVSIRSEKNAD